MKTFRFLHRWLGITATLFILLFAVSGIVLNHRSFFSVVDINRKYFPKTYTYSNMIIKTTPETAPSVNAPIDGKIMFSNSKAESILLTLQPGDSIPEHANPFDVLFIGLTGKAIIGSENNSFEIEPCQTMYIPAGLPRLLKNDTANEIKVMVVKLF